MKVETVTIKFNKKVLWDNWGHYVTAFNEGDIVKATKYKDGLCSAESPYWDGVTDTVYPEDYSEI